MINKVQTSKAYQYAKEKKYIFWEISAKTGENVDFLFEQVANEAYKIKVGDTEEPEPDKKAKKKTRNTK